MTENVERKLTVLLVEDDPIDCRAISSYVDLVDDVRLVGVTNNVPKALEYAQDCLPDVIILDLELHLGGGDGVTFLKELRKLDNDVTPYILVTTNNSSQITYDSVRESGADFIMAKHQDGYNAEYVIEFLRQQKTTLHNKLRQSGYSNEMLTTESLEELSKRIKKRINTELDLIGISPKFKGRIYLVDAIQITIKKPEQHICSKIAQKHNKTESSVERAMQNAINSTWNNVDTDTLIKHYNAPISNQKGVPTLTEFIYYYARKIRDEY
jgi:DNA-binding NarL/FixJ family response regulator